MTVSVSVVLEAESKERLIQLVRADLDPTENDPEYAFTQNGTRPTEWFNGTWEGDAAHQGSTWNARAITPLLGAPDDAEVVLAVGGWFPWLRLTINDEVIVTKGKKITIRG